MRDDLITILAAALVIGILAFVGISLFRPDPDTARRQAYVKVHEEIHPVLKEAILSGAVIVGMTRDQVGASLGESIASSQQDGVEVLVMERRLRSTAPIKLAVALEADTVVGVYHLDHTETVKALIERVLYLHMNELPPERRQALIDRKFIIGMTKQEAMLIRPIDPQVVQGDDWELWAFNQEIIRFEGDRLAELRRPTESDTVDKLLRRWSYVLQHPNLSPEISLALINATVTKGMRSEEVSLAWGGPSQAVQVAPELAVWGYLAMKQVLLFRQDILVEFRSVNEEAELYPLIRRWVYVLQKPELPDEIRRAILDGQVILGLTMEQVQLIWGTAAHSKKVDSDQELLGYPNAKMILLFKANVLVEVKDGHQDDVKDLFIRWAYVLENPRLRKDIQEALLEKRLVEGLSEEQVRLIWGGPSAIRVLRGDRRLWGYVLQRSVLLLEEGRIRDFRALGTNDDLEDLFRRWTYVLENRLSQKIQEAILNGKIDIGMKADHVQASWGEPVGKVVKQSKDKTVEVWTYARPEGWYELSFENDSLSSWTFVEGK